MKYSYHLVVFRKVVLYNENPVLSDHCHKRPPALKDHISLAEDLHFGVIEPVTKDHLSERPYFYGQLAGLSRQIPLYPHQPEHQLIVFGL